MFYQKLNLETEYITTSKSLCYSIETISCYATQTVQEKLKAFKKILYYCSSSLDEAMSLENAQNELQLSIELLFIQERIFNFLSDNDFLKCNICDNINDDYNPKSFSWKMPKFFMPILTAYIYTTATFTSKKISSTTAFFATMDDFMETFSKGNDEIKEIYENWTHEYIGRDYFCKLNNIINTYAESPRQKRELRDSIYSLTRMLVDSPVKSNIIPNQMYSLLTHYELTLKEKITTDEKGNIDLKNLYPYYEPWNLELEFRLISGLKNSMGQLTNHLIEFLGNSLNRNSTYKISVNNYYSFEKELDQYKKNIEIQIKKSLEKIEKTYISIENHPDIAKAIENHDLKLNFPSYKRKDFLTATVSRYKKGLMQKINSFAKKVELASRPHPEKSNSLRLKVDYFNDLKEAIKQNQHSFEGSVNLAFDKTTFLSIYKEGIISTIAYPRCIFEKESILRIAHELAENRDYLLDENIIKYFENSGLKFPVLRSHIIPFLLDFKQIVSVP